MVTSFAEEIAESHTSDCEDADELLKNITLENRLATYAEFVFFQKNMGWDEIRVRDQLRRMHNVVRLQAIAGKGSDRAATAVEAETAAAVEEKELPKLEKQIAELQSKRDALARDSRLSAKRVEEQAEAVRQLRELTPQHIGKAANHSRNLVKSTLGRGISDAEIRINELQCCLSPSRYRSEADYLESLQRSFWDATIDHIESRSRTRKLSPAWPGIRVAIEAELAELQNKLPGLQAEYSAAMAAAESALNFYTQEEI